MTPTDEREYAVLTGDLVKSSRLAGETSKTAMEWLRHAAVEFTEDHIGAVIGRMDTFRHDSWQLLLEQPAFAFRAAVFIRASLKMNSDAKTKFDTRISIGLGKVDFISDRRISDSRGEAFTHSGKGLDAMDDQRLAFSVGDKSGLFQPGIGNGVIPLLDCVISDWTPTESRAVYGALKGWTQEESARNWPLDEKSGKQLTRQAVADSLVRAHWGTVEAVLSWIETTP